MGKRPWTASEVDTLKHLLELLPVGRIDYERVLLLFEGRDASEIKNKCISLRDLKRRRDRRALLASIHRSRRGTQPSAMMVTEPIWEGTLHPAVVWVPTTHNDIEPLPL
jgi:uncharacterized protein (DUF2384 family)